MSLDFDPCFLDLSQYNGDSWPGVSDELVLDDVNSNDLPHLDFDLLWSQLNEEGLHSASSSEPHLSPSPSFAPPANLPWTPPDIFEIGYQDASGDWRCNYSGCLSNRVFLRACDLRKHYRSHQKTYFCKEQKCHRSKVGFSSSKDCRRHMRSHQPMIKCSAADSLGCTRVFSRLDNMKEHHRKIHEFSQNNLFPRPCRRSTRKKDGSKPSELDSTTPL